jgi:hypothetical protein
MGCYPTPDSRWGLDTCRSAILALFTHSKSFPGRGY